MYGGVYTWYSCLYISSFGLIYIFLAGDMVIMQGKNERRKDVYNVLHWHGVEMHLKCQLVHGACCQVKASHISNNLGL